MLAILGLRGVMHADGRDGAEPRATSHNPRPTPNTTSPPRARWTGWRRATSHVPSMRRRRRRRRKTERREEEHEASASAGSSSRRTRGAARALHQFGTMRRSKRDTKLHPVQLTPPHPISPLPALQSRAHGPDSRPGLTARRLRPSENGAQTPGSRPWAHRSGLTARADGRGSRRAAQPLRNLDLELKNARNLAG